MSQLAGGWVRCVRVWIEAAAVAAVVGATAGADVGDFDGDGYQDLAVAAPREDVAGARDAGAVWVLYGSRRGLTSQGAQVFHQGTDGIAEVPEDGGGFGQVLAVGNFNGDPFDDLVIGVPGETVNGEKSAGCVHVLYGSEDGLRAQGSMLFSQFDANLGAREKEYDAFGFAVVGGFFNDDPYCDLAIGAPNDDVDDAWNCGVVHVLYGSAKGLRSEGAQLWSQNTLGVKDICEEFDRFGAALAALDFDGDGRDDLAVGVPGEVVSLQIDAGAVAVLYGGPRGLDAERDQFFTQDSAGIKGRAERGDGWGSVLAAGRLDRGRYADLVVAAPSESVGFAGYAGAVWVLFGSPDGLSTKDTVFHQNRLRKSGHIVPESPEREDFFGSAIAVGDMNADGIDELAIGTPREDLGLLFGSDQGIVQIAVGSYAGPAAFDEHVLGQEFAWVPGRAESGDLFGSSLAIGDFDGDGAADLAIGVAGEALGSRPQCGAVQVFRGSRARVVSYDDPQWWDQDSPGVPGRAQVGDRFGAAMAQY